MLVCAAISARPASSVDARSTTARGEQLVDLIRLDHLRDVELVRIGDGQWTQHDGVDERQNRAARPDAERQREHGDGGKTAPSGEQAGSETQIVQEMFDRPQGAHVATGLLHVIHASHLASSSPLCIRRVVSTRHREVLHLVEMKLQLLVELPLDGPAPQERPQRHQHATMQAWLHLVRPYRGAP